MGKTITEKILARTSGQPEVSAGDRIKACCDLVAFYNTSSTKHFFSIFEDLGIEELAAPEKNVFFIDHHVPVKSEEYAETIREVRELYRKWGVPTYERQGITHQMIAELGYARPGMLVVHHGPIGQVGVFGAFAPGVGTDLVSYMIEGEAWLTVPETVKIVVTGEFPKGTTSRDLWFKIQGDIGADGALNKVLEFQGPAIDAMSIDERMTLSGCCAAGCGAVCGIMNPDEKALDWIQAQTREPIEPVFSDPDADYAAVWEYDVSDLEPYVTVPHKLYDCRPLKEFEGRPIHQAYLGSCDSGRMDDLRLAAKVMKGQKKHPDVRLSIVPTTNKIMLEAAREGLLETFIEAGAWVTAPTCDFCFGVLDPMAAGEVCIATATVNFPGRMGSTKSEIFLANPASVVASAIEGKVTDPRKYL